jgi:hypothetical protein
MSYIEEDGLALRWGLACDDCAGYCEAGDHSVLFELNPLKHEWFDRSLCPAAGTICERCEAKRLADRHALALHMARTLRQKILPPALVEVLHGFDAEWRLHRSPGGPDEHMAVSADARPEVGAVKKLPLT